MKFLNLGCGARFHDDWTNIDFVSSSSNVIEHDLTKGIPFPHETFDFIYHSHVLEHFSKKDGEKFIEECSRVLKKGGIVRVVIPDLEQLAIEYLNALKVVTSDNNELTNSTYNWSVIELFDQMVREEPGGEMLEYWKQKNIINEEHIIKRVGHEYLNVRKNIIKNISKKVVNHELTFIDKFKNIIKNKLFHFLRTSSKDIQVGKIRNGGEIHKWMYDRHSMRMLLEKYGFSKVKVQDASSSYFTEWGKYSSLDIENGNIRKPDSLIIEAYK